MRLGTYKNYEFSIITKSTTLNSGCLQRAIVLRHVSYSKRSLDVEIRFWFTFICITENV